MPGMSPQKAVRATFASSRPSPPCRASRSPALGPWSVVAHRYWSPPWSRGQGYVSTHDPAFLYHDTLIALDTARGINIGQPSFHAHCLDQLAPQEGDAVLQVGAGSGYYTALLAHLVGPGGRVHAYEIDLALAERAARSLVWGFFCQAVMSDLLA